MQLTPRSGSGGRKVSKAFKRLDLSNNYSIASSARKGVTPDIFYDLAALVNLSEKQLAEILHVSPRTIGNYRDAQKRLDPVQGEHLLRLVAMYEFGEEIFGSLDEFSHWLNKPFWSSKERPIDWLVTPGGVALVMDEITRIAYGDAV